MEIYNVKGKVYKVFPSEKKTERFTKQEIVISETVTGDRGTYLNYITLQFINDKCSMINDLTKGDFVVVKFIISGRKIGDKQDERFFTNLDVQDIVVVGRAESIKSDITENSSLKDYSTLLPGLESDDEPDIFSTSGSKSKSTIPIADNANDTIDEYYPNDLPF